MTDQDLIETVAQPEELAAGHLGRFAYLNRLSEYRVKPALREMFQTSADGVADLNILDLLAQMSKIGSIEYAQRHSMMPALRLTAADDLIVPHGDVSTRGQVKLRGMMAPRVGAYACLECMHQDTKDTGYSWFRRAHHLIGIDWCHVHGSVLFQVEAGSPHSAPPHIWHRRNLLRVVPAIAEHLQQVDNFVRRYVDIAIATLSLEAPLPVAATHRALGSAAAAQGLRRAQVGAQKPLSDFVREQAPHEWIAQHIPGLIDKPPMAYMSRVDDLLVSSTPASGDSYMLAFAALFADPVKALVDIAGRPNDQEAVAMLPRRTRGANFWQGEVWGHYVSARGNHSRMAAELEMPMSYLGQRMRSLGLPDLSRSFAAPVWLAFDDFQTGSHLLEACSRHAVALAEVEPLIRMLGVRVAKARERALQEAQRPSLRRRRK